VVSSARQPNQHAAHSARRVAGAAPYLETAGLPGQETSRRAGEAISGQESLETRGFEGLSDLARQVVQRPLQAIPAALGTAAGSLAGSIAAPVAAGLAAAGLGAGAGVAGAVGLGASILTGALASTNDLEELLKREPNVDPDTARRLAVGVGGLIGAGEGGAAGALISRTLGRSLRRETLESIAEMAARSSREAAAKGTLAGIALEGGSELAGTASARNHCCPRFWQHRPRGPRRPCSPRCSPRCYRRRCAWRRQRGACARPSPY